MPESLTRALVALQQLHGPDMPPVALAAWQEARDVILDAKARHRTALVAASAAEALCHAHDRLERAASVGDSTLRAEAENAVRVAKSNLREALDQLRTSEQADDTSAAS
ncbi:hypothetical protein [Rubellimicrobium arenae]|uniref:hypothetical protein n=1 Tax=Rubellimicrobium arenae TaxID=2817372 RepID=UPI001B30C718|nr:hypothetical protein [Rubellimicrobium arenae]